MQIDECRSIHAHSFKGCHRCRSAEDRNTCKGRERLKAMFQVSDAVNLIFQVEHPTNVYNFAHQWRRAFTLVVFGEVASTAKWQYVF